MPFPNSNNPNEWGSGWKYGGEGADIVDFVYTDAAGASWKFYSGVANHLVQFFTVALDALMPHIPGGFYPTPGYQPGMNLTAANVNNYGQWGFEERISRNSSSRSLHGYGVAIDVNSGQNPNSTNTPDPSPYRIPLNAAQILDGALGAGNYRLGKDWGDWMHIECHLSPEEVSWWNHSHPVGGTPIPAPIPAPVVPVVPVPDTDDSLDWLDEIMADPKAYAKLIADIADAVLDEHLPVGGSGDYTTLRRGFPIAKIDQHATLEAVNDIKVAVAKLTISEAAKK